MILEIANVFLYGVKVGSGAFGETKLEELMSWLLSVSFDAWQIENNPGIMGRVSEKKLHRGFTFAHSKS